MGEADREDQFRVAIAGAVGVALPVDRLRAVGTPDRGGRDERVETSHGVLQSVMRVGRLGPVHGWRGCVGRTWWGSSADSGSGSASSMPAHSAPNGPVAA